MFKELETDTTTVIRIFLTQALTVKGFPFEIKRVTANRSETLTESEILDKLERFRVHAAQGEYKVVITKDAEEDLERFIKHLIVEKKNMQAAESVLNDYDATTRGLKHFS